MVGVDATQVKPNAPSTPDRQGAPALEKGLDVLEALAAEPEGIAQKTLAGRIGRSVGAIFRVLGVLERRGYVARGPAGGYGLTLKLFELAHRHPRARRLQLVALPIMQELAERIGQSCYLGVANAERILVVAQAEPHGPVAFAMRLGAHFPFRATDIAARILVAFAHEPRRSERLRALLAPGEEHREAELRKRLDAVARDGHEIAPSPLAAGVTNVGAPVFDRHGRVTAALIVSILAGTDAARTELADLVPLVETAARHISTAIGAPAAWW